jgi:hypothetical protein
MAELVELALLVNRAVMNLRDVDEDHLWRAVDVASFRLMDLGRSADSLVDRLCDLPRHNESSRIVARADARSRPGAPRTPQDARRLSELDRELDRGPTRALRRDRERHSAQLETGRGSESSASLPARVAARSTSNDMPSIDVILHTRG